MDSLRNTIVFNNPGPDFTFRNKNKLRHFLQLTVKKQKHELQGLSYTFLGDKELREMNVRHLNHDEYTDILTFDLSGSPSMILGDIYISTERVKENAKALGLPFKQELHRVIFHGLLHLLGFDDKTEKTTRAIRKQEDLMLKSYFVPRGT